MFKKAAVFSLLLLVFIAGNSFTEADGDFQVTSLAEAVLVQPPAVLKSSACVMKKHNDTVQSFYSGFATGDRIVTYFDPASECGVSAYPYQLQAVSFTLLDNGGYQWPVSVDIVVFGLAGADSCAGPGAELCRFSVSCDSATFALPNVGAALFPTPCCVTGPVFIGIEYTDSGAGPFPSITFSSNTPVPGCDNWGFGLGSWSEWFTFWAPPQPGYPIIWVTGETASSLCGSVVKIDEVRPWNGSTGMGDSLVSRVEISNTGAVGQSLTGWSLGGPADADVLSLPPWTIPGGAYLRVEFGTGTDDPDFSDGMATYYTGSTLWQFEHSGDEVGLYNNGSITDYVGWGHGTSTFGTAHDDAVAAGMWTSGDYVDITFGSLFGMLIRAPSGFDNDTPLDWRLQERDWGTPINKHNPIQISPRHGSVQDTTPDFVWFQTGDGDAGALIQIALDSLFLSPVVSKFTADTILDTTLIDGTYYWRILPSNAGGPYPAAVWSFSIEEVGARPPGRGGTARGINTIIDAGFAPVPQRFQHKDSKLLCIWDLKLSKRPGCTEAAGAAGPWDGAHAQGAHIPNCPHCHMYCTRASIQMVNASFGGSLTQDEITYHFKENNVAGPEGDLGHDVGAWPQEDNTFSWAMNNAAVAEHIQAAAPIPWATLKAEIDAGRPVLCVLQVPFHSVVFDSYYETNTGGKRVYISDPWPGSSGFFDHATKNVLRYYTLAAGATGRNTDPNVATDSDGDGVMDFDEQHPSAGGGQTARTFECVHNDDDTEDDEVKDKEEIKNYTFHDQAGYHPGHENDALNFPDVDGDGLRAENDCDSDDDSDFDGGEDINGDGHNPVPNAGNVCNRETCQFQNAEFCIKVAVDKDVYQLGEPVYIVDQHYTRETHTYHAASTYNYEKDLGCPTKPDGAPLNHNGSFSTDGGGHAQRTLVEYCWVPGQKYLIVDVLDDNLYSTPDNLDPQTCWECAGDWFHGFHWGYDYFPYHNPDPALIYPNYEYPITYATPTPDPNVITYTITCPWWWWCFEWPPIPDSYWLGVGLPADLVAAGVISLNLTSPPLLVESTANDSGAVYNSYIPTEIVQLDLTSNFPMDNVQWFGFEIPNWQLPDSQVSTRVELQVDGGKKIAASPTAIIMAGDAVFGWSPTPYDSIPITVLSGGCCVGNRGDVNGDGDDANILDLTYTVDFIFRGGSPAPCPEEGDVNGDGTPTNILDLTYLVDYIFRGGSAPGPC